MPACGACVRVPPLPLWPSFDLEYFFGGGRLSHMALESVGYYVALFRIMLPVEPWVPYDATPHPLHVVA